MSIRRTLLLASVVLAALVGPVKAAGPLRFYSITPCRIADTRTTHAPRLLSGVARAFTVRGLCGIPTTTNPQVLAVVLNATISVPEDGGHLVLWAYNTAEPATSNLNFNALELALANGASVALSTDATYQIYAKAYLFTPNTHVDLILDVVGYYQE